MSILRKKTDPDPFARDPDTGLPQWMAERVVTAPSFVARFEACPKLAELRAKVTAAEAELAELKRPSVAVQDHEADLDALAADLAARPGRIHAIEQVMPARRLAVLDREVEILRECLAVDGALLEEVTANIQVTLAEQELARAAVERATWRASQVSGWLADVSGELNKRQHEADLIAAKHGWA